MIFPSATMIQQRQEPEQEHMYLLSTLKHDKRRLFTDVWRRRVDNCLVMPNRNRTQWNQKRKTFHAELWTEHERFWKTRLTNCRLDASHKSPFYPNKNQAQPNTKQRCTATLLRNILSGDFWKIIVTFVAGGRCNLSSILTQGGFRAPGTSCFDTDRCDGYITAIRSAASLSGAQARPGLSFYSVQLAGRTNWVFASPREQTSCW